MILEYFLQFTDISFFNILFTNFWFFIAQSFNHRHQSSSQRHQQNLKYIERKREKESEQNKDKIAKAKRITQTSEENKFSFE